ncbi:unnamed protein product, partial [Neospora caninum Liverpool]
MRAFRFVFLGYVAALALGALVGVDRVADAESVTDGLRRKKSKGKRGHYDVNLEMTPIPLKKGNADPAPSPAPYAEPAKWPFTSSCVYNEVELYRPGVKEYLHAQTYDPLAPIASNQKNNLLALRELMGSEFLTRGVAHAKNDLCLRLRDLVGSGLPCRARSVPALDCAQLSRALVEAYLDAFEGELAGSAPSSENDCGKAYAHAVALHDLLVIERPLTIVHTSAEPEELRDKLNALFGGTTREVPAPSAEDPTTETVDDGQPSRGSAGSSSSETVPQSSLLSIGSRAAVSDVYAQENAASDGDSATAPSASQAAASLVELSKLKNKLLGKPLGPPDTTGVRPFPYEPGLTATLHASTARHLFFVGARSPIVSLLYNLLFQAWYRWDELFTGDGASRPFPSISTLLRAGSQERFSHIDGLCGVALKKLKPKPKTPSTLPTIPREKMFRRSRVVGKAKFSCDLLHRTLVALDLAESAAVTDFNARMESLDDEKKKRSVLLEHSASGASNFRRLCLAFRKSVEGVSDVTSLVSCSFADTVLTQASSTTATPSSSDVSEEDQFVLLETKTGATPPEEMSDDEDSPEEQEAAARRNFHWFKLRAAAQLGAANVRDVLSLDYGPWWTPMLFVDERSLKEVEGKATKVKATCAKLGKSKKPVAADTVCTATWKKTWWQKNCSKNLARLLCSPVTDVLGLDGRGTTSKVLRALASSDAQVKKASQATKGRPFASLASNRATQRTVFSKNAYAPALLSALQFYSSSTLSNAELLGGLDHPSIWDIGLITSLFAGNGKRRWLFSRFTGSLMRRLGTRLSEKAYQPSMLQFLHQKLSPETRRKMFQAIQVLVHPLAMKHVNQMAVLYSDSRGKINSEGGFAEEIDKTLKSWATHGMNDRLVKKMEEGDNVTAADFAGVNIMTMPIPTRETLDAMVAERLDRSMRRLQENPENVEMSRAGCDFLSHASNAITVINDSRFLLSRFGSENIMFLGKVVKRSETSMRSQGFFARTWSGMKTTLRSLLRLPPYMARHFVFAVVKVREDLVSQVVKEMATIYNRHTAVFKNEIAFRKAVSELSITYENLLQKKIREPFAVPVHSLLDMIHPYYAQMDGKTRNEEFQASALSQIFAQAWSLFFSVSMNNYINPEATAKLEAEYSKDAWKKSLTDNLAVNSFRTVFLGSDMPLKLYDQLIPRDQKQMLKRAKYGVATMFAYQTVMTGRLYSAQSLPNLGMFLKAQGPYFGHMIVRWQRSRRDQRIVEILSWITLALFCFAAVGVAMQQTTQVVEQVAQNQSSLAPELTGCPPMGICVDGSIGDPVASPPAAATSAVFQSLALVGIGMLLGPAFAIWQIAVSHIKILARFEMVVANAFRRMGRWFHKKWRGRWFSKKQNEAIQKEMERQTGKLKAEQAKLASQKSPDLIDQSVSSTAPGLDFGA